MAGRFRQIQKKIESIRSITKITRAMELVAASRIVKALLAGAGIGVAGANDDSAGIPRGKALT